MKIIEVENCGDCPYRDGMGCSLMPSRDIMDIKKVPDWCPLPEEDEI